MCGGVGSRFWPFSRNDRPKQFIDFFGTGRSLLQLTVDRILPIVDTENIILVTNARYADTVRQQLPAIKEENILLEPARRNTAPCICWAAHHINAIDPEADIITLPADHLILKEEAFRNTILRGLEFVAHDDRLLSVGIKPTMPNTRYGYIQQGAPVEGYPNIGRVKSFTEKPDLDMAQLFIDSGEFFWNSGIYIWKASSILRAFESSSPEIAQLFDSIKDVYGSSDENIHINRIFPAAHNISIDYAVMEKADNVFVQTADLGWSDLGTWNALYEASPQNLDGNVTQNCKALALGCENTLFAVEGNKIVVAQGLKDYIVADTGNALLICPRSDEQKIRQFVTEVRNRFGEEFL